MTPSIRSDLHPITPKSTTDVSFVLEPGECVLWQGRPQARAVRRHLLKVRWLVAYFGLLLAYKTILIVGMRGLHPQEVADAAMLLVQALFLMGLIAFFARALARSTTYTVTNLRIVIQHGVALASTIDIPLNALRSVAVRIHHDGSGDVALGVHARGGTRYAKLWPHVRGLPGSSAMPMLRGLADAAIIGTMLVHELEMRSVVRLSATPAASPASPQPTVAEAAA